MELATLPVILSIAGSAVSAVGTIAAGQAQADQARAQAQRVQAQAAYDRQAREFTALQLEAQGKEEQAVAQRQATQLQREKKLALARLQAVSAGSGFSATDPTSVELGEEIEKYGTIREQMAQYGGASKRAEAERGAAVNRYIGDAGVSMAGRAAQDYNRYASQAKTASYFSAGGSLLSGVGSIGMKYAPDARNRLAYG